VRAFGCLGILLCLGALAGEDPARVRDFRKTIECSDRRKDLARTDRLLAMKGFWTLDRPAFLAYLGGRDDHRSALAADALEACAPTDWALKEGLSHGTPRVRAQVAAYLGRSRIKQSAAALGSLLASDPDEEAREMAARALSRVGTDAQVPGLTEAAKSDKSRRVRKASALALAWLATRVSGDALLRHAEDERKGDGRDTDEALRVLTGRDGTRRKQQDWWERNRPSLGYAAYPGYAVTEVETPRGRGGEPEDVTYGKGKRRCELKRLVYVLDVSGSIPARKKQQKDYATLLEGIHKDTLFDAIAFSVNVCPWKGFLVPADPSNLGAAGRWIECFDGMSGATPLSGAMRKALTDYDVDEILLCTDGGGNTGVAGKDLFDYIQAVNVCRRVRLRGIPVGNLQADYNGGGTVGEALERLLSESGGGHLCGVPPQVGGIPQP
jgi:hypothetical protein